MKERGNEAPMIIGPREIVRLLKQTAELVRKVRRRRR
jgi:hypothetical protein